ncbi:hypothetical protein BDY17DRAFT_326198 [Neohortaea acidophila]|uniref:Uncharacterized protein n=1 Tax=Neohortaea acidophila TaxID=245834 RepID=A0A6A6PPZ7_9PEZI|nr:uncharacterized protein BDY17DRAFT_326198 [Neohortaea acidophila]KAF2481513.1 hypothetical protein BDY17DRAFT_326198 [Neohortaea acidophila]
MQLSNIVLLVVAACSSTVLAGPAPFDITKRADRAQATALNIVPRDVTITCSGYAVPLSSYPSECSANDNKCACSHDMNPPTASLPPVGK